MNPAVSGTAREGPEERTGVLNEIHRTGTTVEPAEVTGDGFALRISGDFVPVGDRLIPDWLELDLAGDASTPTYSVRVEVRNGVPRIVDLRFRAEAGQGEVRQSHLRETQVEAILDVVAAFAMRVVDVDGGPTLVQTSLSAEGEVRPESLDALRRSRSNRKVTPEFLQEVAEVYRANLAMGPTKAVRERFFVSQRMASEYVQRARRAGLLPPTSPGRKKG